VGLTGTRLGEGSGEAREQVTEAPLDGDHSLPLYKPRETAEAVAEWFGRIFKT
jgi:hypothetical protein